MEYKIKIVMKYRGVNDTVYSIPSQEAHKAYYLYFHPEQRGVFSNGLAIRGEDIERIVPDYNGTMGWNQTYVLGDDDWNELKGKGIKDNLEKILIKASEVAKLESPKLELPLTEAVKTLPSNTQIESAVKALADKMGSF